MRQLLIFPFLCLCFTLLPSGSAQNVTHWRAPEGTAARADTTAINAIAFSLDGTQLAIATTNGITVSDTYTGKELALFPTPLDSPVALAFSPDGHTLATGSFREIRLWNLTTGHPTHASVLKGHRDMVITLAFSPDSKTLASTSFYGTISLWDVQTGQRRHNLPAHTDAITALAFSPDNQTLASGGYWSLNTDSTIHLWDVHTGHLLTTVEGHTDPVFALAFSPDSRTLASAGWDNTIRLWHPQTGQLQATFESDTPPILALAFLFDAHKTYSKTLASASFDGTIQLRPLPLVSRTSDVNADGVVNVLDLTFVAAYFGKDSPDLNGDGVVNILDLVLIAQQLGE